MNFVIYGTAVQSSIGLPLTLPEEGDATHRVRLEYLHRDLSRREQLPFETPNVASHGRLLRLSSNLPFDLPWNSPERRWKMNVQGLFAFEWLYTEDVLTVSSPWRLDLEKLSFWLLHFVVPVYLILRRSSLFIHASAVKLGDGALGFVAPSRGGKSTLAGLFVRKGYPLLSDDKLRIITVGQDAISFPSHPYIRVDRTDETLGRLAAGYCTERATLSAMYEVKLLNSPEAEIKIEPLQGLEKFEAMQKVCLFEPVSVTEKVLRDVSNLAGFLPFFELWVPRNLEKLELVYQRILDHVMGLKRHGDHG